jgi:hypothetical protein
LVENGLAIPKPPLWGKNNDPNEWWSANDFEILSAAYRHGVEGFLKIVAPYFPRGPKDIHYLEPRTPPGPTGPFTSITELPAPCRTRIQRFGETDATNIALISTITRQGRLATLLNDEADNSISMSNKDHRKDAEENGNPFSKKDDSKDFKGSKEIPPKTSQPPPGPPDDSSESNDDSEPRKARKIIPHSNRPPPTESLTIELKPKSYHFDLKLKPELVPQWNGNPDVLARWISKINRLANNSQDV